MRFSAFLSTALLVGFVAAAPTKDNQSSSSSPSSSSSYDSGDYDSSSSSSSGYDSSNNNYGSNNNNYGSSSSSSSSAYDSKSTDKSSSSYGYDSGSSNYGSSSSSAYDSKSTDNSNSSSKNDSYSSMSDSSKSTSSEMMDSTSTSMYDKSTATTSSALATSTMSYGSGSNSWGGSGYNDCVQQCIASYGAPAATYTPPSSTQNSDDGSYSGSKGTGATHTVIVAPTQGVLRFIPFAVNASVGDTILFDWHANNHTVTKSSALEVCNKTSDALFASGEHNAPFTFTQVVNDTNPTFFYCGTPGHCQKGMFGIINPPSSFMTSTSIALSLSASTSNSSDMAAMMASTNMLTAGNDKAASWGQNIDLASLPDWSHSLVMENVMYTRSFLGTNPETIKDDGSIDMSGAAAPLSFPMDMAPVNAAVDSSSSSSPAASSTSAGSAASSASPAPTGAADAGKGNGAASTAASSALLGFAAIAAAVLAF